MFFHSMLPRLFIPSKSFRECTGGKKKRLKDDSKNLIVKVENTALFNREERKF